MTRQWLYRLAGVAVCAVVAVLVAGIQHGNKVVAAEGNEVGVADVYAKSGGDNAVYATHFLLHQLPRLDTNWPIATGSCVSNDVNDVYRGRYSPYKALPFLPAVPIKNGSTANGGSGTRYILGSNEEGSPLTEYLDDEGDIYWSFNKNGAYRNAVGNCETTWNGMGLLDNNDTLDSSIPNDYMKLSQNSSGFKALRALRNGGTCGTGWEVIDPALGLCPINTAEATKQVGGLGNGGYSVNPFMYGGWAKKSNADFDYSSLTWKTGGDIEVKEDDPQYNGCDQPNDCSNTMYNGTNWVRVRMNDEAPEYGHVATISGLKYHDPTDYLKEKNKSISPYRNPDKIYQGLEQLMVADSEDEYLSSDLVWGYEDDGTPPRDSDGRISGLGLYSDGLSLFRTEFVLSQDDLNTLKAAQDFNPSKGGLFLDLVADDFYSVYVNGCPLQRGHNTWNSALVQKVRIPLEMLHGPQNTACKNLPVTPGNDPNMDSTKPNLVAIEVADRIQIGRGFHDAGGTGLGFAVVRYDRTGYNLTPIVGVDSPFVPPGGEVMFDYRVANSGVASANTNSSARQIIVKPGVSLPGDFFTSHTDASCGSYDPSPNPDITCAATLFTDSRIFPGDSSTGVGSETATANYAPGTRICRVLVVEPRSSGSSGSRDSVPTCVTVAKAPQVHFWGDDVTVGNNSVAALLNNKATVETTRQAMLNGGAGLVTYGSWAEYGIFAPALVKSTSGGAVSGSGGYTGGAITDTAANNLTFANVGGYGQWSPPWVTRSVEQFASQFPEDAPRSDTSLSLDSVNISPGEIKRVPMTHGGNIKLSGSYSGKGAAILITNQTVVIDGDIIVNENTINSIGTAPQLIIIANNIIVNSNVTRIDAWLVARPSDITEAIDGPNGKVSTCDSIMSPPLTYSKGLKFGVCDRPLQINGSLIAKEVQFRRTYGAEQTTGLATPAEVINLRADAYMWAHKAGSGMSIDTDFTIELPPRY